MARRSGNADLPLHHGRVPRWLSRRMEHMGRLIAEAIVLEYGRDELLRRLAHPFWFQSFGCLMGMDWHSSGVTTSVVGALKRGLAPVGHELGIHVCGGRGKQSRRTPVELRDVAERTSLDGDHLARTSRLVAKVDSAAVQDGFQLYLHTFIVSDTGAWTVVQQGMDTDRRQARRYHWLSEKLDSFVEAPHAAITGPNRGKIINLTDRRARTSQRGQLDLLGDGPDRVLLALGRGAAAPEPVSEPQQACLPHLTMPARHDIRQSDVRTRRLQAALRAAAERGPRDFPDLLLTPGVGARTVASLALATEIVFGAPYRFTDPARFAMAHGGKDGHPFPVPLRVYDRTLSVLRGVINSARLGQRERLDALRRLDAQARLAEVAGEPMLLREYLQRERARTHQYGGRTVGDPTP